jgi:two-component system, OmpR family, osmolarity sensor histidine kinase EnvZ
MGPGLRVRSRRFELKLPSPTLFWRTFLLIVSVSSASLVAWVPTVRVLEREPRAHQLAERVVSMVHATRNSLVYSDPARRRGLLSALFEDESLRVVPLEPSDQIEPVEPSALMQLVEREVVQRLGAGTRLASSVNGINGFWVSFAIDDDAYWVYVDRDLNRRDYGSRWIAWALPATLFSLIAAFAIARVVNRPLAELSRAAGDLGSGRIPQALPESAGPVEIRTVNQSFNRMVSDLEKLNQDRAVLLAGVSHDLRTPLTRLRLEIELSEIPESSREAMVGDLEQMDQIVNQFLDYALPAPRRPAENVDLTALVRDALLRNRLLVASLESAPSPGEEVAPDLQVQAMLEPAVMVPGHRTELARILDNLLRNAQRYGRSADGRLNLEVTLRRETDAAVLVIADRGPGIHVEDIARLIRPFERGDASRSGAAGTGLGLAIVERVARMHGARFSIRPNHPSGLRAELHLPLVAPAAQPARV